MIPLSLTFGIRHRPPWNDGLTASSRLLGTVGASATEGFLAPAWGIHSDEETCIYLAGKLAFCRDLVVKAATPRG